MWYEVIPCVYKVKNARKERLGLYIHRRKTNEYICLDKNMNKVKDIDYCHPINDRGQAFFNLNPKWLPYQK